MLQHSTNRCRHSHIIACAVYSAMTSGTVAAGCVALIPCMKHGHKAMMRHLECFSLPCYKESSRVWKLCLPGSMHDCFVLHITKCSNSDRVQISSQNTTVPDRCLHTTIAVCEQKREPLLLVQKQSHLVKEVYVANEDGIGCNPGVRSNGWNLCQHTVNLLSEQATKHQV